MKLTFRLLHATISVRSSRENSPSKLRKPVVESTAEEIQVAAVPLSDKDSAQPLLMVEIVNVTNEKFKTDRGEK